MDSKVIRSPDLHNHPIALVVRESGYPMPAMLKIRFHFKFHSGAGNYKRHYSWRAFQSGTKALAIWRPTSRCGLLRPNLYLMCNTIRSLQTLKPMYVAFSNFAACRLRMPVCDFMKPNARSRLQAPNKYVDRYTVARSICGETMKRNWKC